MIYYSRKLENTLAHYLTLFPAVAVCGPRQSGKSTMLREKYSHSYRYITFDDPLNVERFRLDPRGFINEYNSKIIFDEVQKVPEIFNHIKILIDTDRAHYGKFILTGSSQFAMIKNITESLAGRIGMLALLPFQYSEIPSTLQKNQILFGGYPENIVRKYHGVHEWYASYITNYIERDVRSLHNIVNLKDFQRLLSLLAAHTAQELNMHRLADDIGVTVKTIKSWISVLEASYIVFTVLPYHNNLGKRIVKRPKIYFYDTGLVCYLTGIHTHETLEKGPLAGPLHENYVFSELKKIIIHHNKKTELFYFRDNSGIECDCIIEDHTNSTITFAEIKHTATPKVLMAEKIQKILHYAKKHIHSHKTAVGTILYRGKEEFRAHEVRFVNYLNFLREFEGDQH